MSYLFSRLVTQSVVKGVCGVCYYDFRTTMFSTVRLRDHEFQVCFYLFETFYTRRVQRPITLAVCEIGL